MHLIITLLAAVAAFFVWYIVGRKHKGFHLEILPIMLGAASIMWLVDAFYGLFGPDKKFLGIETYVVEDGRIVAEGGAQEFQEAFYQGMNDMMLGLSVIVAALVVYAVIVIILDPLHLYRKEKEAK